jgi:hypothetical protein
MESDLIYGVGISNKGEYAVSTKSTCSKEYKLWVSMLQRCYSEEKLKRYPSYMGCSVSENFKYFQYFAQWCNDQIGYLEDKWQLDKDILVKGNKVYSEDTCVFVPCHINSLVRHQDASTNPLKVGIRQNKSGVYSARLVINGVRTALGTFQTIEEAFIAYKTAKERYIRTKATQYKDRLDPRAYEALFKWEVAAHE